MKLSNRKQLLSEAEAELKRIKRLNEEQSDLTEAGDKIDTTSIINRLGGITKEFRQAWNDMRIKSQDSEEAAIAAFSQFLKSSKLKGRTIGELLTMGFELSGSNDVVSNKDIKKAVITSVEEPKASVTAMGSSTTRMEYLSPSGSFWCHFTVKFPDGKLGRMSFSLRGGSKKISMRKRMNQ